MRGRLFSRVCSQTIPGAVALALGAMFGVWILHTRPAPQDAIEAPAAAPAAAPAVVLASIPNDALFDPSFVSGPEPVSIAQSIPIQSSLESNPPAPSTAIAELENVAPTPAPAIPRFGESAPLPLPRPIELGSLESRSPLPAPGRRFAQQNRKQVLATTAADNRSFFEKFFGVSRTPGPALAYAAPEEGVLGNARGIMSKPSSRYDRWTAVYDVAAHTVYMPNGTRLEAHSGFGDRLDDPRYVHERMRGPTPPNVYELQPREQLFHGVQALRLIPAGNGELYGRTGLLAHTYMLGPNGDSNGCVSFRNYNAFLQAYQNGEIKRLVVVSRLN